MRHLGVKRRVAFGDVVCNLVVLRDASHDVELSHGHDGFVSNMVVVLEHVLHVLVRNWMLSQHFQLFVSGVSELDCYQAERFEISSRLHKKISIQCSFMVVNVIVPS